MVGLIAEIQRDSVDERVKIESVLRKMKIAATKLNLDPIEAWVNNELNGYESNVPKYRIFFGTPEAFNPYNGWIPIISENAEFINKISMVKIKQSISTLQDLINEDNDSRFYLDLSPSTVLLLSELGKFQIGRAAIRIERGNIISIINAVRNMALDWAIEMEKRGVLGEEFSFAKEEKIEAHRAMNSIKIGYLGSFTGNMGSNNSSEDIISSVDFIDKIKEIMPQLESHKEELTRIGVDGADMADIFDKIKKEIDSENPRTANLRGLVSDLRNVISGAAGNMLANGAISMLTAILGA